MSLDSPTKSNPVLYTFARDPHGKKHLEKGSAIIAAMELAEGTWEEAAMLDDFSDLRVALPDFGRSLQVSISQRRRQGEISRKRGTFS